MEDASDLRENLRGLERRYIPIQPLKPERTGGVHGMEMSHLFVKERREVRETGSWSLWGYEREFVKKRKGVMKKLGSNGKGPCPRQSK